MRALSGFLLLCAVCCAQTTLGLITGRVIDQKTGQAIAGVNISCRHQETGETSDSTSDAKGFYSLLRLPAGVYWIRAGAPGSVPPYQPRETYELELYVAGRVQLDIPLRQLADTYSQSVYAGAYLPASDAIVHTYAADFATTYAQPLSVLLGSSGTLLSTLSYVIDPRQVRDLPLSGRDIYTMLVALPGVTADNATARGLGLSVNGQRSSSSNFLLDGVENNDHLLTGPLTVIAPEAVQEYRVSTNNYSAEYGRTSGFVANAVTRAGTNSFHGVFYGYLNDTALDANSYPHKSGINTSTGFREAGTLPRQPQTDLHAGFWAGGRFIKDRLFWSAAYERFRSRGSGDVLPFQVPVLTRFERCYPGSRSVALLEQFRPPVSAAIAAAPVVCGGSLSAEFDATRPLEFDRHLALSRLDRISPSGAQRLMARAAVSRFAQPDFVYSVYPGLSSTLDVDSASLAVAHLWVLNSKTHNEVRFGFRNSVQGWNRPHPETPVLSTTFDNGALDPFGISLPGNEASYDFHYGINSGELSEVLTLSRTRHVLSAGGGVVVNRSDSKLTFRRDGLYEFDSLQDFAADRPAYLQISARRAPFPALQAPNYSRDYANQQFYGFFQDNIQVSRTLGINLGLRYESFGAPKNTGVQDGYFQLGEGAGIDQRLARARLVFDASNQRSAYRPDRNNWAGRLGIFHDVSGRGRTVLRAAYGIFYDRPFENLTLSTRNNDISLVEIPQPPAYPSASLQVAPGRPARQLQVPGLLWVDEGLRTPYTQSWFAGVQHQFTRDLYSEVTGMGALGRKLIGTDVVNRRGVNASSREGALNPNITEDIFYRSNFASSNYSALTALTRYRARHGQFQIAYTWSHSIDNQSDPLQGNFDDLGHLGASNIPQGDNRAAFTRQFDSRLDRGNSDFDQRHNLFFYSIWETGSRAGHAWRTRLLEHWQLAQMAGFRSGFPFNVIAHPSLQTCPGSPGPVSSSELIRNRPSLVSGSSPFLAGRVAVPGGYQLLDAGAFCWPGAGVVGNLGRNALTGPGFWNVDISVARSFRPRWIGEASALQLRADFFNAFNHANLGNPEGLAEVGANSTFGQAFLGRQGVQPSFPSAAPLDQLSRQVQLQLKLVF